MQSAGAGPAARTCQSGPALELPLASDDRLQAMRGIIDGVGARLQAVEDIDLRLIGQQAARGKTLAEMGDEEDPRARGPQRRRRLVEPDPVGVRLHHRRASPRRRAVGEAAPIVRECGKIDGEAARGAFRRGEVDHESRFSITAVVGASKPSCASTLRRAKLNRSNSRSFSGSASRTLSLMRLAPRSRAAASHASIRRRVRPRARKGGTDTRPTCNASPSTCQRTTATRLPPWKAPTPPPDVILAATLSAVSRSAEEGGRVARLWAAKAGRMTSAASLASAAPRARKAKADSPGRSAVVGSKVILTETYARAGSARQ